MKLIEKKSIVQAIVDTVRSENFLNRAYWRELFANYEHFTEEFEVEDYKKINLLYSEKTIPYDLNNFIQLTMHKFLMHLGKYDYAFFKNLRGYAQMGDKLCLPYDEELMMYLYSLGYDTCDHQPLHQNYVVVCLSNLLLSNHPVEYKLPPQTITRKKDAIRIAIASGSGCESYSECYYGHSVTWEDPVSIEEFVRYMREGNRKKVSRHIIRMYGKFLPQQIIELATDSTISFDIRIPFLHYHHHLHWYKKEWNHPFFYIHQIFLINNTSENIAYLEAHGYTTKQFHFPKLYLIVTNDFTFSTEFPHFIKEEEENIFENIENDGYTLTDDQLRQYVH